MSDDNNNYDQSKYFNGEVKTKDNEKLKRVPYLEPKLYLKEGEYNLDDLFSKTADAVIRKYIEHNPIIRRYAVDVLRHFVFDKSGKIIRGFDEWGVKLWVSKYLIEKLAKITPFL